MLFLFKTFEIKKIDLMVKDVASCDFDLVVKALWFTIAFDLMVKDVALTTRSKRGGYN